MLPYGLSIFCDDIRVEQNGTFDLIGCYGPDIIVFQQPPLALPKFGILIYARFPLERFPERTIMIYMPDEKEPFFSQKIEAETEDYKPIADLKESEERDLCPQRAFMIPLLFSPFVILKEGHIRVRMLYGSERIRMGVLKVIYKPAPTPEPVPSVVPLTS